MNIYKYITGLFIVLLVNSNVEAQQEAMYTQYMHNQLTVNPAYAGSSGMLSAMALARNQWQGFEGAPKTRTFSLHAPIEKYNLGTGVSIISDRIGPVKQNSFFIDFAWHMPLRKGALAMGIKAGFDMMEINLAALKTDQSNDPYFQQNINNDYNLNFGVGLYYYSPRFYLGVSIPHMFEQLYYYNSKSKSTDFSKKHYFVTSGTLIDLNEFIKLKPSVLFKIVSGAPVSIDVSANIILYDKFWIGANYRIEDSLGFMLQYQLSNQVRVGYAYDLTNSKIRTYSNGTHELMVSYDFNFSKRRVKNPRYF